MGRLLLVVRAGAMENYSTRSDAPWYNWREDIKTVVINNGVTSIGDYVFFGCDGLISVTCLATTPPSISYGNFTDVSADTLYVPASSLDAYKNSNWSNLFELILPLGDTPIATITAELVSVYPNPATDKITIAGLQGNETITIYNVSGQTILIRQATGATENIAISNLSKGVYLVKVGDKTLKVVKK